MNMQAIKIERKPLYQVDAFLRGYVTCALWSSNDESTPDGGEPMDKNYDYDDVADETLAKMIEECEAFKAANAADLATYCEQVTAREALHHDLMEYAGHDFWLNRNHHGAGFWDRTGLDEEVGERLSEASHEASDVYLYVSEGQVWQG